MNKEVNKPLVKRRFGKFQVSIWKTKKLFKAKNDYDVEREIEIARACIQRSQFNKQTSSWTNQSIWCNPDELRNLVQVLDDLNGFAVEEKEGVEHNV
jgi:predicted transglutaminase-like protease